MRPALLVLLAAALVLACAGADLCGQSPLCDENQATNCEPSCTVGPCSNSPFSQDCGEGATCQVLPGDINSTRFFRSRALCVVNGSDVCDPDTAPAPTCDGLGNVQGCSAYGHFVVTPCSESGLFFANAGCCSGDGGTSDGGLGDGGMSDGGAGDGGTGAGG
jgi:hypothetical protein